MDRNRNGGMTGGGPRGLWRYLDSADSVSALPQRTDRRSAAPQGNCCEEKAPIVVITPFMEK